jgi:CBS domain containing-hemolysin-like protein
MELWLVTLGVMALCVALTVVSYVDRVYLHLGQVITGRVRDNLDIFETEIEPRLKMERQPAALTFRLLSHLLMVMVALLTVLAAVKTSDTFTEIVLQEVVLPVCEVFFFMHLIPNLLLTHSTGRWLGPFVPLLRLLSLLVSPIRLLLEAGVSVAQLHAEQPTSEAVEQESLEALVEAGEEQGILEPHDAKLIEQVVEFGDVRVREVMTPRPDMVAIPATATLAELRQLMVDSKFSRVPVFDGSLDEVIGIAHVRDLLEIPEAEAARRRARELVRPVMFVPETKLGSELLRELQQKKQQMAIAIDEYGGVAGLVTTEDLVEEIVGEIEDEDRKPAPEAVREADGAFLVRGSTSVARLEELLGVTIEREPDAAATTAAGLMNELAGHVPAPGEIIQTPQVRFDVVDANQRKVLRLRARLAPPVPVAEPAREESPVPLPPKAKAPGESGEQDKKAAKRKKAAGAIRSGK